ncbi:hypothetical protein C3F09_03430 [candidate division GN15 bacterium]|uniref:Protein kinase domain-containing protein n=1 Tax=candidate division GN15 bacterium TaxID=2072418 RepID=A0A855X339_9BACT|nr:MAG: hypothetical protein C3F09_03430 [candidate division GN15 bacterium]
MGALSGESRYQRLHTLGRGGTAEVSAVHVTERGITAALKVPLADSAASQHAFTQLAAREALLIGRERFPGIVRLLELPPAPAASLLMELCPGPTLDRVGRIDNPALLLNILSSLALDLAFLNGRGIIHADLKPQNFFLPSNWKECGGHTLFYTKLSDFSLGRFAAEPDSARAGAGTVGYMAPETIRSGRTSHQSDLFALGVIGYQLATGIHPFLGEDAEPVRVNARVTEENPRPVREIRPDLPTQFSELLSSLLSKQEGDRPQFAFEVCVALENSGAVYPFRRALWPSHLMAGRDSFEEALEATVSPDLHTSPYLLSRTMSDKTTLRLFLSANVHRGTIQFDGKRFGSIRPLQWPSRLRNQVLTEFSRLPHSGKRQAIIEAVLHGAEMEPDVTSTSTATTAPSNPARSELLLHLLRSSTVRRLAAKHVLPFEHSGNPAAAAGFCVMAGNLAAAERCACDAATQLQLDHQSDSALRVLRRVISLAELRNDLFSARHALMSSGDIYKAMGNADRAQQIYQQIISVYAGHLPDGLLAETYKDLGDLFKMKQEFQTGIAALEQALAIYRKLDDEIEISHTLNNLGNIHWINSDLDAALSHYRTALQIQRRRDLRPDIASTVNNIASIYVIRTRFARAIRLLQMSLELKKEIGNAGEIARTLNNLGYAYVVSGQPALAVDSLKESLAINRRIGSRKEQLFNLENLSEVTLLLGRVKESIRHLDEGLTLSAQLQDKPHLATLHLNLANAHLRLGQIANAEQSLKAARSFLDQIDHWQAEAFYLIRCAEVRRFIGDCESAVALADRAAQAAGRQNDRHTRLQALLILTRLDDKPELRAEADSIADDLQLKREQLLLSYNRIERHLEQARSVDALQCYERASDALENMVEDIESARLWTTAAEVLIEAGRTEEAGRLLDRALAAAQRMGLVPEMAAALALRARMESSEKAYEKCYASSRQALQLIKQVADNVDNDKDRAAFLQRRVVQKLMTEVRRLGVILGQKQRAE